LLTLKVYKDAVVGRDLLTPKELVAMFSNLDEVIAMHGALELIDF
jgi:hypothetical protein